MTGIQDAHPPAKRDRTVKSEHSKNGSNLDESDQGRSNFTVPGLVSLSGTGTGELQFVSDDWSDYADLSKLPRRSGVTSNLLRRLVLKELADNALDECDRVNRAGKVTISKDEYDFNTYTVTDEGEGLNGTPEQIAAFFSLRRPKATSKLWPLPKRGAVGNGLRVIVGAVASGGGSIIIETRGQKIVLCPQAHNGSTTIKETGPSDRVIGTAITINVNPRCPRDPDDMLWARLAISAAPHGIISSCRRANPHWIDCDHFCEMLRSVTPGTSVRDFTAKLDGCTSTESRKRITEKFGLRRLCSDLPKNEAAELLVLLQSMAKPVKAKYLGQMGKKCRDSHSYARVEGEFTTGDRAPQAVIPFVVECWATAIGRDTNNVVISDLTINRSPAIGDTGARRWYGRNGHVNLCGSILSIDVPEGEFEFAVNLTSPRIPIVSEGKLPDLSPFREVIGDAIQLALRRAAKHLPEKHRLVKPNEESAADDDDDQEQEEEKPERVFLRQVIWGVIPEAISHCCFNEDGVAFFQFNQRDLFYVVRRLVTGKGSKEPKYAYFTTILTDYENEVGEIDLLTRDDRGIFTAPHGGELIPMGTKTVAAYERPAWEYSNFVFVEKEKIVTLLKQVHFDDRWDCFISTAKGFCTRAGKDLLDKIAEKDEPTKFFCVHDADASGPLIAQALVEATRTREARNVDVIDLGFFPWTAEAEDLLKEPVEKKRRKTGKLYVRPVADCVKERDLENEQTGNPNNEPNWQAWLQEWRIELNAVTPPQFVEWINTQFEMHGAVKTIPPEGLASQRVADIIESRIADSARKDAEFERRKELDTLQKKIEKVTKELEKKRSKILEEVDEKVAKLTKERWEEIELPTGAAVVDKIKLWLLEYPHSHWRNSICSVATDIFSINPTDEQKEAQ